MPVTSTLQTLTGSISWTASANWTGFAAPAAGDTIILAGAATIDTGYVNTATLASLQVPLTFTGTQGLAVASQPVKSVSGITRTSTTATATSTAHGYSNGDSVTVSGATQTDYNVTATISNVSANTFDYTVANTPTTPATTSTQFLVVKNAYLVQPATLVTIGTPGNNSNVGGNGSSRFLLNTGTAQATVTVLGTSSSSSDTNLEPVRLLGSHASNTLYMIGGLVGLATSTASETSTFATINQTGGTLNLGSGCSWTTIQQSGGSVNVAKTSTSGSFTQTKGATAKFTGTGTYTNMTVGGTTRLDARAASGDTVTGTLQIDEGGILDLTGNPASINIATLKINGNVKIRRNRANPSHLTWTTLTQQAGSSVSFE